MKTAYKPTTVNLENFVSDDRYQNPAKYLNTLIKDFHKDIFINNKTTNQYQEIVERSKRVLGAYLQGLFLGDFEANIQSYNKNNEEACIVFRSENPLGQSTCVVNTIFLLEQRNIKETEERVRYVGNEGFLASSEREKVLDEIFDMSMAEFEEVYKNLA